MTSVQEELRAAGFAFFDAPLAVRVECTRLARILGERSARTIGLLPAADDVAVPAVAIELGRGLAEQGAVVGVVDAEAAWSCAPALLRSAAPDGKLFATSPVSERLAVLTPREAGSASATRLRDIVAQAAGTCSRLLVDLTGFDHLGEQLDACEVLDGVLVVARSGRTTAREVERWVHELPPNRGLGVLLTGTRS